MRLKSFGLIEAIIGSAIVIVFVVAMALLGANANRVVGENAHRQVAEKIADDFISRIFLLKAVGRVSFGDTDQASQVISVDCFSTEKGESCKKTIMDAYPQNQFPFFDMVSTQSSGSYKSINNNYLKLENLADNFFKIKTEVKKASCDTSDNSIVDKSDCRQVYLEIYWNEPDGIRTYSVNQYLTNHL